MTFNEVNPTLFYKVVEKARKVDCKINANLSHYEIDDYWRFKCYLSPDSRSGYTLHRGELLNVFSVKSGRFYDLMKSAIENGANRLDCFEGYLVELYLKCGFTIDKIELNWNAYGPSVYYMSIK